MSRFPRPVKRRRLSNEDAVLDDDDGGSVHSARVSTIDKSALDKNETADTKTSILEKGSTEESSRQAAALNGRTHSNGSSSGSTHATSGRALGSHQSQYAGRLHGSNAFRLQLEDLLTDHQFTSTKLQAAAETALRRLKGIIEGIPDTDVLPIVDAEHLFMEQHKVAVPFPSPRPGRETNYKLQFRKPSHINVVGSYPLRMIGKPKDTLRIDMLVVMPKDLFQDKDYLDYRYFYRRAFYIAHIAAAIRAATDDYEVTYSYLNGSYLQPIVRVRIRPEQTATRAQMIIRIIPGMNDNVFVTDRTLPYKSCLRTGDNSAESGTVEATPFYNGALRMDALFTPYLRLFSDVSKLCGAFHDACALGRIWLAKRGFATDVSAGGFGNFEWTCTLALLLGANHAGKAVLSPGYNSYQLFKALLQFLASKDLAQTGYTTLPDAISLPLSHSQPCLFDAERGHNILFKMTPWSFRALRRAAQSTVELLSSDIHASFEPTFLIDVTAKAFRYDATIDLSLSPRLFCLGTPTKFRAALQRLHDVLQKSLTNRVHLIDLRVPAAAPWPLNSAPSSLKPSDSLQVGLLVDPSHVSRAMDRGPTMDNKKDVKAYLDFWGQDKAVRMKFGNESPVETVKWETVGSGPSVLQQIVEHSLGRHFGADLAQSAHMIADEFVSQLAHGLRPFSLNSDRGSSTTQAFATFERDLRSIEGLPLQVRQILAAGPIQHETRLHTASNSSTTTSIDVIVKFEGSSRWPRDLGAIQRTKMVFLLKMKELYAAQQDGLQGVIGLENTANPAMNQAYLDLTYTATKTTFRIRINHEVEQALLNTHIRDPSASEAERKRMAQVLAKYKRDFHVRPAHLQAIQALCNRYPALPAAIRLTKAWFGALLMLDDSHISEELVELMVARTFTTPWPWEVPGSPSIAFIRTLDWLAGWDWRTDPLIVDLSTAADTTSEMEPTSMNARLRMPDVETIRTRFEAHRHMDPALNHLVLFAASNVDRDGATWSDYGRPTKVVAARMTRLAQAAVTLLRDTEQPALPESLFTVSLEDFHFIIHLRDDVVHARAKHAQTSAYKNLALTDASATQAEGRDPTLVQSYLLELRSIYGDAVVLFCDHRRGRFIAGLWNPAMEFSRWKVKMPVSVMPGAQGTTHDERPHGPAVGAMTTAGTKSGTIQTNRAAILHEMVKLGGDLVRNVVVHTSV